MIKIFSNFIKAVSENRTQFSSSSAKDLSHRLNKYPYLFKGLDKGPVLKKNEVNFAFISDQTKQLFHRSYSPVLKNLSSQKTTYSPIIIEEKLLKKLLKIQTQYFSGNSNEISMSINDYKVFVMPEGKDKNFNFRKIQDKKLPIQFSIPEQFNSNESGILKLHIQANYYSTQVLRPRQKEYKDLIKDCNIFGKQKHSLIFQSQLWFQNFNFLGKPYLLSKIIQNPRKFGQFAIVDIDHSKQRTIDPSRYNL